MTADFRCGDAARLGDLLDDRLPPGEQAELAAHLEGCETCRRAFDALAGGGHWWEEVRDLAPPPDAGRETAPGPSDPAAGLDFLGPPAASGHLGRFGPYEVTEVLGRGGMGVVFKAFDPALHRPVAVKVLAPQLATSASARKRFLREARAAASVVHEHVVTIHAVDEAGGLPYLVMAYVAGRSLQERIDDTGPLDLAQVLRIGAQAAQGLAAAHAQGLVHRDVKPANILLENGVERVKLTDFGLARAVDDASLTQSGVVAGTPQYMAPEQARGEPVDHRADLFSLGSVLYAMCTGRAPFRAETTVAVLRRVCDDTPRPVREVNPEAPEWLEALIARLHAKDPAARFQTASEVAERLGRQLARLQQPTGADAAPPDDPDVPPAKAAPRPRGVGRRAVLAAAAILTFLVGGLGLAEATGSARVSDLLATVLRVPVRDGTLIVEVNDPEVAVGVDGEGVTVRGAGVKELRLSPGLHRLRATRGGLPLSEQTVTVSRGGKVIVRVGLEPNRPPTAGRAEPGSAPPGSGPRVVAKGEGSEAFCVAYSPDGKTLAAGYMNGTVVLCDPSGGGVKRVLEGPISLASCLAFSPDGKTLAVGTGRWQRREVDGEIDLWDVDSGKQRARLLGHKGPVFCVAFSPDGREVVSGGYDGSARVWDAAGGNLRGVLSSPGSKEWIFAAAYSPDGKTLATAGADMEVHLYDAANREHKAALGGQRGQIECLAFSPDGRSIATGGRDKVIRLRDVATYKLTSEFLGHSGWVSSLAFSPDGATLASAAPAGDSKEVKLWDVASGKVLFTPPRADSHTVAFAPDGKSIATGDLHGNVSVWDVSRFLPPPDAARGVPAPSASEARRLEGHTDWVYAVAYAPDGKTVASAGLDKTVKVWDTDTGRVRATFAGHTAGVRALAFAPDGRSLASGGEDSSVKVWDLATGRPVASVSRPGWVWSVAFAPDGKTLASASGDPADRRRGAGVPRGVVLRDLATGKEQVVVDGEAATALAVAFSPDGKSLGVGTEDGRLRLWEVASGRFRSTLVHPRGVRSVAFSPDGRYVATGGAGPDLARVWEVESGRRVAAVRGPSVGGWSLAFAPDGLTLAVTLGTWEAQEKPGKVMLCDPASGRTRATLVGFAGPVWSVAFAPDGKTLATGDMEGLVRLWEAPALPPAASTRPEIGRVPEPPTPGPADPGR